MTIQIWPFLIAVLGAIVWGLFEEKSPKVSKAGAAIAIIGAAVVVLNLGGKTVRLGSLVELIEGTAHAQPAEPSPAAAETDPSHRAAPTPDDDVPEPTADDPTSPIDQGSPGVDDIATAMRAGRWLVVFGIILNVLVGLMKRHGSRLIANLISPKVGGWLQTKRGVVFTALALAGAGTIGTAMAAGRVPGFAEIGGALALAWTASGFHAQSTSVAEGQVEVKVEPKPKRAKRPSTSAGG